MQRGRFIKAPAGKGSLNHPAFAGLPSLLRMKLSPFYQDLALALSQFLKHFLGKCCHVRHGQKCRLRLHKQKVADSMWLSLVSLEGVCLPHSQPIILLFNLEMPSGADRAEKLLIRYLMLSAGDRHSCKSHGSQKNLHRLNGGHSCSVVY